MKIIRKLFFLCLVVFPFGQLAKFANVYENIDIYFLDVLVFLIVSIWLFQTLKNRTKIYIKNKLPLVAFFAIGFFALVLNPLSLSGQEVLFSSFYLLRFLFYILLFFPLKKLLKKENKTDCLLAIGLSFAIFGIVQLFLWPNLKPLEVFEWDPHFYRLVSTFLDPNFAGIILTFSFLISLVFSLKRKHFWFLTLFFFVSALLTQSRSSLLSLFFGILIIAFFKLDLKKFLALLLIFTIGVIMVPKPRGQGGNFLRFYTIDARLVNYSNAIEVIKDHPILGVGFNSYRFAQREYGFLDKQSWSKNNAAAGVDSSLLLILATTGLLGFLMFLSQGVILLRQTLKIKDNDRKVILLSCSCALFIHALFVNSLFYPWVMFWMIVLLSESFSFMENK